MLPDETRCVQTFLDVTGVTNVTECDQMRILSLFLESKTFNASSGLGILITCSGRGGCSQYTNYDTNGDGICHDQHHNDNDDACADDFI